MIYPFLLLSLWPQHKTGQTLVFTGLLSNGDTVSQPISHLRDFFDARSLAPGEPVFLFPPAVAPQFDAAKELAFFPTVLKQQAPTAPAKVAFAKPTVSPAFEVKPVQVSRVASKPVVEADITETKPADVKPVFVAAIAAKAVPMVNTPVVPAQPKVSQPKLSAPRTAVAKTMVSKPASHIGAFGERTAVKAAFVSRFLPAKAAKPDAQTAAKVANTASAPVPAPAPTPAPAPKLEDIPVTLNMAKAPFRALLDQLMKQTGADLLLLADTAPDITIKVTKHRFIDTLTDMCAMANLSFLKVNNEYVIATDDKLKAAYPVAYALGHPAVKSQAPDIVNETYNTNYCDAQKLADTLAKEFKPDELSMFVAPSSVQPSLGSQDSSSISGVSSSVLEKDTNKTSRILILRGPRDTVNAAISVLKAMDVKPKQVNISVTINDMSLDAEKQLGLQWTFPQLTLAEKQPSGIGFSDFTRSPLTFNATMSALETKGLDKLLASPNITVEDGQRAYILVGQRLEFPVVDSFNQNGTPIFSIDQERVGIYLQVSVWISNDGKVKLDLYPQVSTVSSFINVNGGSYPQIATRECQTTLTVESGHTIVIGGLIHDEEITNLQQVPILSKIPIFGELFTNRTKSKTKDEVIITITPTIDPK